MFLSPIRWTQWATCCCLDATCWRTSMMKLPPFSSLSCPFARSLAHTNLHCVALGSRGGGGMRVHVCAFVCSSLVCCRLCRPLAACRRRNKPARRRRHWRARCRCCICVRPPLHCGQRERCSSSVQKMPTTTDSARIRPRGRGCSRSARHVWLARAACCGAGRRFGTQRGRGLGRT